METSLTTFDGYPRADIDVAQIRTTRARIRVLKNDHKALMAKLEVVIQAAFASAKPDVASEAATTQAVQPSTSSTAPGVASGSAIEPPFAKVNTIAPNSPADQAGMQLGDKVTKFGSVNWTNHERLGRVAQVVQQNENRSILVKVLREGSGNAASRPLELRLTPRRDWGGRGLLGCHLLPV